MMKNNKSDIKQLTRNPLAQWKRLIDVNIESMYSSKTPSGIDVSRYKCRDVRFHQSNELDQAIQDKKYSQTHHFIEDVREKCVGEFLPKRPILYKKNDEGNLMSNDTAAETDYTVIDNGKIKESTFENSINFPDSKSCLEKIDSSHSMLEFERKCRVKICSSITTRISEKMNSSHSMAEVERKAKFGICSSITDRRSERKQRETGSQLQPHENYSENTILDGYDTPSDTLIINPSDVEILENYNIVEESSLEDISKKTSINSTVTTARDRVGKNDGEILENDSLLVEESSVQGDASRKNINSTEETMFRQKLGDKVYTNWEIPESNSLFLEESSEEGISSISTVEETMFRQSGANDHTKLLESKETMFRHRGANDHTKLLGSKETMFRHSGDYTKLLESKGLMVENDEASKTNLHDEIYEYPERPGVDYRYILVKDMHCYNSIHSISEKEHNECDRIYSELGNGNELLRGSKHGKIQSTSESGKDNLKDGILSARGSGNKLFREANSDRIQPDLENGSDDNEATDGSGFISENFNLDTECTICMADFNGYHNLKSSEKVLSDTDCGGNTVGYKRRSSALIKEIPSDQLNKQTNEHHLKWLTKESSYVTSTSKIKEPIVLSVTLNHKAFEADSSKYHEVYQKMSPKLPKAAVINLSKNSETTVKNLDTSEVDLHKDLEVSEIDSSQDLVGSDEDSCKNPEASEVDSSTDHEESENDSSDNTEEFDLESSKDPEVSKMALGSGENKEAILTLQTELHAEDIDKKVNVSSWLESKISTGEKEHVLSSSNVELLSVSVENPTEIGHFPCTIQTQTIHDSQVWKDTNSRNSLRTSDLSNMASTTLCLRKKMLRGSEQDCTGRKFSDSGSDSDLVKSEKRGDGCTITAYVQTLMTRSSDISRTNLPHPIYPSTYADSFSDNKYDEAEEIDESTLNDQSYHNLEEIENSNSFPLENSKIINTNAVHTFSLQTSEFWKAYNDDEDDQKSFAKHISVDKTQKYEGYDNASKINIGSQHNSPVVKENVSVSATNHSDICKYRTEDFLSSSCVIRSYDKPSERCSSPSRGISTQDSQSQAVKHLTKNPLVQWKRLVDLNIDSLGNTKDKDVCKRTSSSVIKRNPSGTRPPGQLDEQWNNHYLEWLIKGSSYETKLSRIKNPGIPPVKPNPEASEVDSNKVFEETDSSMDVKTSEVDSSKNSKVRELDSVADVEELEVYLSKDDVYELDSRQDLEQYEVDLDRNPKASEIDSIQDLEGHDLDSSKNPEASDVDSSTEHETSDVDSSTENETSDVDSSTEHETSDIDSSTEREASEAVGSENTEESKVDSSNEGNEERRVNVQTALPAKDEDKQEHVCSSFVSGLTVGEKEPALSSSIMEPLSVSLKYHIEVHHVSGTMQTQNTQLSQIPKDINSTNSKESSHLSNMMLSETCTCLKNERSISNSENVDLDYPDSDNSSGDFLGYQYLKSTDGKLSDSASDSDLDKSEESDSKNSADGYISISRRTVSQTLHTSRSVDSVNGYNHTDPDRINRTTSHEQSHQNFETVSFPQEIHTFSVQTREFWKPCSDDEDDQKSFINHISVDKKDEGNNNASKINIESQNNSQVVKENVFCENSNAEYKCRTADFLSSWVIRSHDKPSESPSLEISTQDSVKHLTKNPLVQWKRMVDLNIDSLGNTKDKDVCKRASSSVIKIIPPDKISSGQSATSDVTKMIKIQNPSVPMFVTQELVAHDEDSSKDPEVSKLDSNKNPEASEVDSSMEHEDSEVDSSQDTKTSEIDCSKDCEFCEVDSSKGEREEQIVNVQNIQDRDKTERIRAWLESGIAISEKEQFLSSSVIETFAGGEYSREIQHNSCTTQTQNLQHLTPGMLNNTSNTYDIETSDNSIYDSDDIAPTCLDSEASTNPHVWLFTSDFESYKVERNSSETQQQEYVGSSHIEKPVDDVDKPTGHSNLLEIKNGVDKIPTKCSDSVTKQNSDGYQEKMKETYKIETSCVHDGHEIKHFDCFDIKSVEISDQIYHVDNHEPVCDFSRINRYENGIDKDGFQKGDSSQKITSHANHTPVCLLPGVDDVNKTTYLHCDNDKIANCAGTGDLTENEKKWIHFKLASSITDTGTTSFLQQHTADTSYFLAKTGRCKNVIVHCHGSETADGIQSSENSHRLFETGCEVSSAFLHPFSKPQAPDLSQFQVKYGGGDWSNTGSEYYIEQALNRLSLNVQVSHCYKVHRSLSMELFPPKVSLPARNKSRHVRNISRDREKNRYIDTVDQHQRLTLKSVQRSNIKNNPHKRNTLVKTVQSCPLDTADHSIQIGTLKGNTIAKSCPRDFSDPSTQISSVLESHVRFEHKQNAQVTVQQSIESQEIYPKKIWTETGIPVKENSRYECGQTINIEYINTYNQSTDNFYVKDTSTRSLEKNQRTQQKNMNSQNVGPRKLSKTVDRIGFYESDVNQYRSMNSETLSPSKMSKTLGRIGLYDALSARPDNDTEGQFQFLSEGIEYFKCAEVAMTDVHLYSSRVTQPDLDTSKFQSPVLTCTERSLSVVYISADESNEELNTTDPTRLTDVSVNVRCKGRDSTDVHLYDNQASGILQEPEPDKVQDSPGDVDGHSMSDPEKVSFNPHTTDDHNVVKTQVKTPTQSGWVRFHKWMSRLVRPSSKKEIQSENSSANLMEKNRESENVREICSASLGHAAIDLAGSPNTLSLDYKPSSHMCSSHNEFILQGKKHVLSSGPSNEVKEMEEQIPGHIGQPYALDFLSKNGDKNCKFSPVFNKASLVPDNGLPKSEDPGQNSRNKVNLPKINTSTLSDEKRNEANDNKSCEKPDLAVDSHEKSPNEEDASNGALHEGSVRLDEEAWQSNHQAMPLDQTCLTCNDTVLFKQNYDFDHSCFLSECARERALGNWDNGKGDMSLRRGKSLLVSRPFRKRVSYTKLARKTSQCHKYQNQETVDDDKSSLGTVRSKRNQNSLEGSSLGPIRSKKNQSAFERASLRPIRSKTNQSCCEGSSLGPIRIKRNQSGWGGSSLEPIKSKEKQRMLRESYLEPSGSKEVPLLKEKCVTCWTKEKSHAQLTKQTKALLCKENGVRSNTRSFYVDDKDEYVKLSRSSLGPTTQWNDIVIAYASTFSFDDNGEYEHLACSSPETGSQSSMGSCHSDAFLGCYQESLGRIKFSQQRSKKQETHAVNAAQAINEASVSNFFSTALSPCKKMKEDKRTVLVPCEPLIFQTIPVAIQPKGISLTPIDEPKLWTCETRAEAHEGGSVLATDEGQGLQMNARMQTKDADGCHESYAPKNDSLQFSLECLLEMLLQRGKVLQAVITNADGEVLAKTVDLKIDNLDIRKLLSSLSSSYNGPVKMEIFNDMYTCFKHEKDGSLVGRSETAIFAARQGKLNVIVGFADPRTPGSCIKEMQELSQVLSQRGL